MSDECVAHSTVIWCVCEFIWFMMNGDKKNRYTTTYILRWYKFYKIVDTFMHEAWCYVMDGWCGILLSGHFRRIYINICYSFTRSSPLNEIYRPEQNPNTMECHVWLRLTPAKLNKHKYVYSTACGWRLWAANECWQETHTHIHRQHFFKWHNILSNANIRAMLIRTLVGSFAFFYCFQMNKYLCAHLCQSDT